ncbi:Type cbb3 cytochrome oxidase biogenesis protein CcoG, involved in Cu oxidation [Rhodovulum sp. PH10]|uniref:cytochrome c oxidase accessory protein CcoG n=1 Tax=Rhodovulum sp. PH10 TaxID=1187851 RepID=UPI00027C1F15|nr:cytochrome c oxidase accessory protein CcoG [Rhodovulum sp. PH10]EJW09624.1 Type cbb3 cytochrome oxidase biogenesis protein CcoG, involved in Cu oxidation [Rhodovulum sp. PH10]
MNVSVKPPVVAVPDEPLYASAKKVYPQRVTGRFRSIKWMLMGLFLGVYYLLPFVRWDRGPNAPSQAVLVDLPNRRFYFFFIELWPQEVYYFTGLLVIAAMTLFLMNAIAGRVWCGYACPQTVWTDLFYAVERWIEGDRRARMKKAKEPLSARRVGELVAKHSIWLIIAWWTGGAWVLYFADAPTLVYDLATFQAPLVAYAAIGILTFTTYTLAGHMREQVCIYMCPWPRIQAALTDEWALNVTYRRDRGEPRTSIKKAADLRALGEKAGDCVDCLQCVAVCPTGVDIRHGSQLGCIQCGLCIDACDNVMAKVGRPTGLIAYDNDINIERRQAGKPPIYRFFRARTVIYLGIIALTGALMLYSLYARTLVDINVLHDRNPLYVTLSNGSVRNAYTIRFLNKRSELRTLELTVTGVPIPTLHVIGEEPAERTIVAVGPDQTREVRVLVTVPPDAQIGSSNRITFEARDVDSGDNATSTDHFFGP